MVLQVALLVALLVAQLVDERLGTGSLVVTSSRQMSMLRATTRKKKVTK
jgi:hypothetical protein